jgi:hypothetical protein
MVRKTLRKSNESSLTVFALFYPSSATFPLKSLSHALDMPLAQVSKSERINRILSMITVFLPRLTKKTIDNAFECCEVKVPGDSPVKRKGQDDLQRKKKSLHQKILVRSSEEKIIENDGK